MVEVAPSQVAIRALNAKLRDIPINYERFRNERISLYNKNRRVKWTGIPKNKRRDAISVIETFLKAYGYDYEVKSKRIDNRCIIYLEDRLQE